MDAATPYSARGSYGTHRLLAHCAELGQAGGSYRISAQARLERELGGDFTRRLIGALVSDEHPRSTSAAR